MGGFEDHLQYWPRLEHARQTLANYFKKSCGNAEKTSPPPKKILDLRNKSIMMTLEASCVVLRAGVIDRADGITPH
jgi:hypothetical protein